MSKYTTQIRWLVENGYNLGLDKYPIFDEAYRKQLNEKIIEHYYFREIGAETPDLFKRFLNRKMNEIMPYYNQLYKSAQIEIDPLHTVNLSEIYTKKNNGQLRQNDSTDTNRNDSYDQDVERNYKNLRVDSDTPQSYINDSEIANNHYASFATRGNNDEQERYSGNTKTSENQSRDLEQNTTNKEDYDKISKGNAGKSESELLLQYRETFLNIDMMVIDELSQLFMNIW